MLLNGTLLLLHTCQEPPPVTLKALLPALFTKRAADKIRLPDEVDVTVLFNVRAPPATSVDVAPALILAPTVSAPLALRFTEPLNETELLIIKGCELPEMVAVKDPVPLMALLIVVAVFRLNTRDALSVMLPITLPVIPPLPICSVPALIVVTPE